MKAFVCGGAHREKAVSRGVFCDLDLQGLDLTSLDDPAAPCALTRADFVDLGTAHSDHS